MAESPKPATKQRLTSLLTSGLLHGSAIAILSAGFCKLHMNTQAVSSLGAAWAEPGVRSDVLGSIALIVALVSCLWALIVIIYKLGAIRLSEQKKPTIKLTRGTIITETLIVFPVFLLLTFGLAQMGVNSMAGLLTSVATYEAGRTVAVWAPEIGHNRTGAGTVTRDIVKDRARIVAAGIIAPVVPAAVLSGCTPSQAMQRMQAGMFGALGVPAGFSGLGKSAIGSIAEGFDTQTFATRGYVKHFLAYCAVSADFQGSVVTDPMSNDRAVLTTEIRYNHPNVMPLVGPIFTTDFGAGPWAMPNVAIIKRSYGLTQQLSPNPNVPTNWAAPLIDFVMGPPDMEGESTSLP